VVDVGKAGHICAASPGGPRYDPSQTKEERRSQSNGIWLCSNHHDLIDLDPDKYTVDLLKQWKLRTETECLRKLVTSPVPERWGAELDLFSLSQKPDERLIRAKMDLARCAAADLQRFRHLSSWPIHSVKLRLALLEEGGSRSDTNFEQLAFALKTFNEFHLVSSAGTGKTTTLLQIAGALLEQGGPIPLFLPLAEWSIHAGNFFQFVRSRAAFSLMGDEPFRLLARRGELLLALDGWNELPPPNRQSAAIQIAALRRDYDNLRILVSTRRLSGPLPFQAREIEIESLNQEQQQDIAIARRGREGIELLRRASEEGLSDLITTPIYFDAFLNQVAAEDIPRSKDEILGRFVSRYENEPSRWEALDSFFSGTHRNFLVSLAAELTSNASTAMAETKARSVVSKVGKRLAETGQISTTQNPAAMLEALTNRHILVRTADGAIAFQHQVFMEWFSSFQVEEAMSESFWEGRRDLRQLRERILNVTAWEEAVLFACERVSRSGLTGRELGIKAVSETIQIDPILAGKMIRRSHPEVWLRIKPRMVPWVYGWFASPYEGTRSDFSRRVPRPFRLMLLLNDEAFKELVSNKLAWVDDDFCETLLNETGRSDLQRPPGHYPKWSLFPLALSRQDRPVASIPNKEVSYEVVDPAKRAADYDFKSALKLEHDDFWRVPGMDEGEPAYDFYGDIAAFFDDEKHKKAKIGAYFANSFTISGLILRILRLRRRIARSGKKAAHQRMNALGRVKEKLSCCHSAQLARVLLEWKGQETIEEATVLAGLIANHGVDRRWLYGSQDWPVALKVPKQLFDELVNWVGGLIERSCENPGLTDEACFALAGAVSRLPSSVLFPYLRLLLPQGTEHYWDTVITCSHVVPAFWSPFIKAFVNMGGSEVIALMRDRIGEPAFALEAASVLLLMRDPAFEFVPRLDAARKRLAGHAEPPRQTAGSALDQALSTLGDTVGLFLEQRRAKLAMRLAQAALAVEGALSRSIAERLLRLDDFPIERSMLLKRLALAGVELDSETVAATLQSLLRPDHQYLRGHMSAVSEVQCLFLFSDNPDRIADHLPELTEKAVWNSLDHASVNVAERALVSLANASLVYAGKKNWLSRMIDLGTESSARTLVEMCSNQRWSRLLPKWVEHTELFRLFFKRYPTCRIDLIASTVWREQQAEADNLLTIARCAAVDVDAILHLIHSYAEVARKFDLTMSGMLRDLLEPTIHDPIPVPVVQSRTEALRQCLFQEVRGQEARAALARRCLSDLDDYRDMGIGYWGNERHPEISSGLPWPDLPFPEQSDSASLDGL
jgi:hypothetical protein